MSIKKKKVLSYIIKGKWSVKHCIDLTNTWSLLCVRHSASTCEYNIEQEAEIKPIYKLLSHSFLAIRLPPATTQFNITLFPRISPTNKPFMILHVKSFINKFYLFLYAQFNVHFLHKGF